MATLAELRSYVQQTVDDPSFDAAYIDMLINEALVDVSMKVLLPDLESSTTIQTVVDANLTPLPADLQRNLYRCLGEQDITVLSSVELLLRRVPDDPTDWTTGAVEFVTRSQDNLFYYPAPAEAKDLVIYYYTVPTPLTLEDDTPDVLPGNLHRKLLCSYACKEMFDDIEDGLEGQKVNTARHESRYFQALAELEAQIKQGQSRPQPGRDRNTWV